MNFINEPTKNIIIQFNYASILNARYTEVYEAAISLPDLIIQKEVFRYPGSFKISFVFSIARASRLKPGYFVHGPEEKRGFDGFSRFHH